MYFFHFWFSLMHLWSVTGALHMVQYYRVRGDTTKTILNEEYPKDDPFFLESLHMRQIICDRIIRAKQYMIISYFKYRTVAHLPNALNDDLVPELTNFQRVACTPQDPNPLYLHHHYRRIRLEGRAIFRYRKTLECVRTQGRNWFIFLTRKEDQFLLCEPYENDNELVVTAMFEPKAEYNMNFPGLEGYHRMLRYFYDEIKSAPENRLLMKNVPAEMTLCNLSFAEYGRLCITAFDTLSHRDIGYFQESVRYINYNNISQRSCLLKKIDLISGEEVRAKVVPCAINRVYRLPQFYILADSKVPGSVFILMNRTKKSLELVARLGKITVLLERATRTHILNQGMHFRK